MTCVRLFVYGSLKPGFSNHNRYCRGVRSIETAHIEGRLFQTPTGYPVLRLADSRILARGCGNLFADIETQERLAGGHTHRQVSLVKGLCRTKGRVYGAILTFADTLDRLRAIDDLEEFRPGRRSRYERVLISIYSRIARSEVSAWTYIAGQLSPPGRLIPTGRWPAARCTTKGVSR